MIVFSPAAAVGERGRGGFSQRRGRTARAATALKKSGVTKRALKSLFGLLSRSSLSLSFFIVQVCRVEERSAGLTLVFLPRSSGGGTRRETRDRRQTTPPLLAPRLFLSPSLSLSPLPFPSPLDLSPAPPPKPGAASAPTRGRPASSPRSPRCAGTTRSSS